MKKILIALIVMTLIIFSGCNNATSPENSESYTINKNETDTVLSNESDEIVTSTETISIEDSQSKNEAHPNQYYLDHYDYYIYDRPSSWSSDYIIPIVMGFNYPYKADDYSDGGIYPDRYSFNSDTFGNLHISMENYIPTNTDELKIEIETPYGTAKIYWCVDSSDEVACLSSNGYDFKITWSKYDIEDYSGTLEKMLPTLLTPIESTSNSQVEIIPNTISVEQIYDAYMYYSTFEDPIIGFNELDGVDSWFRTSSSQMPVDGVSSAYKWYQATNLETGDYILVTADEHIYKYVLNGRSLCEIIETETIDTPFGIAKLLYIKRTDTSEPVEEEIAIINNNGRIVTINYWNKSQNSYNGTYDYKLKEILPLLFN